ncbi:MAG: hypothetical protein BWX69_03260 [Planctomycetes bacterium ADurb.Bin069]|nr:MAG: hypothetical protein BWX69_03260 [Planctomycetes bacterium ADurb.Bin069]
MKSTAAPVSSGGAAPAPAGLTRSIWQVRAEKPSPPACTAKMPSVVKSSSRRPATVWRISLARTAGSVARNGSASSAGRLEYQA